MHIFFLMLPLIFGFSSYASDDRTIALHAEMVANTKPNLTEETNPILYALVRELTEKAVMPMPRYISTFSAQYLVAPKDGGALSTVTRDMNAYVDVLGDLYVCRDLLTTLSYEEIQGVVAIALAQKKINKPLKMAGVFVGTLGATLASVYCLNKYYDGALLNFFAPAKTNFGHFGYYRTLDTREREFKGVALLLLLPSFCTMTLAANYLQKSIDTNAAGIADTQKVIAALRALNKVRDMYEKEGFFSRLADACGIKEFFKLIFYPVRSYTTEERIAYLTELQNS